MAILWMRVLFFFSGQNADESGSLSGFVTQLVLRVLTFLRMPPSDLEHVLRKLAHFFIFAVEGFLLRMGLSLIRTPGRRFLLASFVCAPLAVFNELHELTSEGRSCSPVDMAIDFSGALAGILFASLFCLLLARWRKRHHNTGESNLILGE